MSRRPKLRSIGIAGAVTATLLLMMLAPVAGSARPLAAPAARHPNRTAVGSDSWRLFKATNQSRGRFDVPTLRLNRELSAIARRHSMAMARNGELFHTTNVDAYLHGIGWHIWGENVGFTPGDVEGMERAFMDSPPHRENILNRAFRQVAIGSVRVDGTLWVTVFFYG
jgi:uncharacterized protein YkwD